MVKCTIADEVIKKLKKKRSKPNGVISRLYTSTKEMNECRYKLACIATVDCNEQPYVLTLIKERRQKQPYLGVANINPNHHNCASKAIKQAPLIIKKH